jgi:Holliday junction resolvase-like predicted endonuclease
LFRPTKPKAKLLQNLLQSHEIRFGDAFEKAIEQYLYLHGCELLPKRYQLDNGDFISIDQCFRYKRTVYFIEQKVRDDHDSTKKRGQIQNFEKKLNLLLSRYAENELVGIFYFIDPELTKNKRFYIDELAKMTQDYNVETHIFYGEPLFDYLKMTTVWQEILGYLAKWKKQIPDLPEINFDLEADTTFEEIKDLKPIVYRKLFANEQIFKEIILTLFPEYRTLKMLLTHFEQQTGTIYKTLAQQLKDKIK